MSPPTRDLPNLVYAAAMVVVLAAVAVAADAAWLVVFVALIGLVFIADVYLLGRLVDLQREAIRLRDEEIRLLAGRGRDH